MIPMKKMYPRLIRPWDVPNIGDWFHITKTNICWRWNIPFLVDFSWVMWNITGHLPSPVDQPAICFPRDVANDRYYCAACRVRVQSPSQTPVAREWFIEGRKRHPWHLDVENSWDFLWDSIGDIVWGFRILYEGFHKWGYPQSSSIVMGFKKPSSYGGCHGILPSDATRLPSSSTQKDFPVTIRMSTESLGDHFLREAVKTRLITTIYMSGGH